MPLMKISPVMYSSRVSATNSSSTSAQRGSGIKHAPYKSSVPSPYMGRYGPLRNPGLIHFFMLKKRRKNSSITLPPTEPTINKKASSKKIMVTLCPADFRSKYTMDKYFCQVLYIKSTFLLCSITKSRL